MKTKHTPGPWIADNISRVNPDKRIFVTIRDSRNIPGEGIKAGREIIANAYGFGKNADEVARANAELIAHAPETAERLEQAERERGEWEDTAVGLAGDLHETTQKLEQAEKEIADLRKFYECWKDEVHKIALLQKELIKWETGSEDMGG